jgi:actin-like ATPase involved in cell morphogenesis
MAPALGIVIGSDAFVRAFSDSSDITRIPAILGFDAGGRPVLGRPSGGAGREYRDFTSRVGDPVPLVADGEPRPGTELVATAIGCLAEGAPTVVVAYPAVWTEHAVSELRDALSGRGIPARLVSEAEAAYASLRAAQEISERAAIVLCNVGAAGTDLAVVRPSGESGGVRVERATHSREFGGELVDSLLFEHVLAELSGTYQEFNPADRRNWDGLRELRGRVVHAKQQLSQDMSAVVEVNLPGIREQLRIMRAELEALIAEPVEQAVQRITRTADAAVGAGYPIEAVVLIGGSSAIPLLAEYLSTATELPIANSGDPGTTVARGAALLAARTAARRPGGRSAARVLPPGQPAPADPAPIATAIPKVPAPPRSAISPRPAAPSRPAATRPAPTPAAGPKDERRGSRPISWAVACAAVVLALLGGGVAFGLAHHESTPAQTVNTVQVSSNQGGPAGGGNHGNHR